MISRTKLAEYLHHYLQVDLFSDYCPNGLQFEGKESIETVACAVTASRHIIEKAIAGDFDALIVHHGLFWKNDPYPITGLKKGRLKELFKSNLSVFAYHLPLDAHEIVGNNWKAARDLGWKECQPFSSIGVQGKFEPVAAADFQRQLEDFYDHPAWCALGGKEVVSSAALISGGAHRQIEEAIASGIDCFITGSVDEPVWHLANEGDINFFGLGHAATERIGPRALANHLEEHCNITCHFIDEPNPF